MVAPAKSIHAQIAAEDLAAALGPIDAIAAPLMPASPAQAATHIQARYRGNRGRWLADRREGLRRREDRRQRRFIDTLIALRNAQEAEAEQNALNMAPTGIFWLDRARVPEAVAQEATAFWSPKPTVGGGHTSRCTFTGGRRRSRKKRNRGPTVVGFVAGAQYLIFSKTPKKKQKRKDEERRRAKRCRSQNKDSNYTWLQPPSKITLLRLNKKVYPI